MQKKASIVICIVILLTICLSGCNEQQATNEEKDDNGEFEEEVIYDDYTFVLWIVDCNGNILDYLTLIIEQMEDGSITGFYESQESVEEFDLLLDEYISDIYVYDISPEMESARTYYSQALIEYQSFCNYANLCCEWGIKRNTEKAIEYGQLYAEAMDRGTSYASLTNDVLRNLGYIE